MKKDLFKRNKILIPELISVFPIIEFIFLFITIMYNKHNSEYTFLLISIDIGTFLLFSCLFIYLVGQQIEISNEGIILYFYKKQINKYSWDDILFFEPISINTGYWLTFLHDVEKSKLVRLQIILKSGKIIKMDGFRSIMQSFIKHSKKHLSLLYDSPFIDYFTFKQYLEAKKTIMFSYDNHCYELILNDDAISLHMIEINDNGDDVILNTIIFQNFDKLWESYSISGRQFKKIVPYIHIDRKIPPRVK